MKTRILKAVAVLALVVASVFALASCNLSNLAKRYTVLFMVDGAEHARVYSDGKTVELPDAPTKSGYTFDGWYFDKDEWKNELDPQNLETTFIDVIITVHAKFNTETAQLPGTPENPGTTTPENPQGPTDEDDTDKVVPDDDSWDDGNLDTDGWTDPNGGTTIPGGGTTTPDSGDTGSGDTGSGDTGSGDTGSGDTGSGDTGSGDTGSGDTGSGDTGSGSGSSGSSNDDNLDGDGWTKPN